MALTAPKTLLLGQHARSMLSALDRPADAQPEVKRAVGEHYRQLTLPVRSGRLAASLRQERNGAVYVSKQGVLIINHVPYAGIVVRRQRIPDPPPAKIVAALGRALFERRRP